MKTLAEIHDLASELSPPRPTREDIETRLDRAERHGLCVASVRWDGVTQFQFAPHGLEFVLGLQRGQSIPKPDAVRSDWQERALLIPKSAVVDVDRAMLMKAKRKAPGKVEW